MTNKDEALKLALEALEECRRDPRLKYEHQYYDKTITAIREALAESALERMAKNERELGLDYMVQPAQDKEPCGWRMKHNGEWAYSFTEDAWDFIYAVSPAARKAARDNAPASKPWVGLTLQEIETEWDEFMSAKSDGYVPNFVRAIEAKLKDKNGY